MFASQTLRWIFSRCEKINLIKIKPYTVGEAFRLPLRTVKKNLTSITEANGLISLPAGVGGNRGATALYGCLQPSRLTDEVKQTLFVSFLCLIHRKRSRHKREARCWLPQGEGCLGAHSPMEISIIFPKAGEIRPLDERYCASPQ